MEYFDGILIEMGAILCGHARRPKKKRGNGEDETR